MKTKTTIVCLLTALLLFSNLTLAVGENIPGSTKLSKGWNLVTIYVFDDDAIFETCGSSPPLRDVGINAVFFYDKYEKEYIRLYPNCELGKLEKFFDRMGDPENGGDLGEYGSFTNSALWVHSNKERDFSFTTLDGPLPIEMINLQNKWNFLTVTSDIVGKSLDEISGNCDVKKATYWDSKTQNWKGINNNKKFDNELLWKGFVVKVADDCKLGTKVTAIPELP
ncbi:hypothetical protein HYT58_03035 [Candidatus Woesearchaeota archaeon]|nr:hypothetical protein [Candidatus Woesearchaeota archaeon]